jgi:hypothetical protein
MRKWISLVKSIQLIESEYSAKDIAEMVYQDMDWSSGCGDTVISDYRRDHDIEDDDPNDWDYDIGNAHKEVDIDSPEFKKWFMSWVQDRYEHAEWEITHNIENGRITLWRCITAPEDWKPDPNRHLGIYWSWDQSAADAHWGDFGNGHVKWMIEGSVKATDIDWAKTLAMNAQPAYEDEKEVRINDGATVDIIKVYRV